MPGQEKETLPRVLQGPILYLIFINDLDAAVAMVDIVRKFADDTKLGSKVETDLDRENLQAALNRTA